MRRRAWLLLLSLWWLPSTLNAAPDLALEDFDGKARKLSEFIGQGKWVVVTVWSADCPICRREIYHMTFFHDDHKKRDAIVLGLSIDGKAKRDKALAFAREQSLNFPNLLGTPDDASLLAGTMFIGTPTYYFFAPDGGFAGQRVGPATQEDVEALIKGFSTAHGRRGKKG